MTLKQLEAFYWAALSPSFAMAAEKLHLSVSSLSKRIAELEASMGKQLFDRHGNRAELSAVGEFLLPRARELLMAAEKLTADVKREDGLTGHCRIGAGELTAMTWLPRLMRRLHRDNPRLGLESAVAIGGVIEQKLVECALDVAIVAAKSSNSAISSQAIASAHFAWYGPQSLAEDQVSQDMLDRQALISLPVGSGITRLVDDWLRDQGLAISRRIVSNHWSAVAGMIREEMGIGVLPQGWADAMVERLGLRKLSCFPSLPCLEYFVQWRSDDYRPMIAELRRLCTECADFNAL